MLIPGRNIAHHGKIIAPITLEFEQTAKRLAICAAVEEGEVRLILIFQSSFHEYSLKSLSELGARRFFH